MIIDMKPIFSDFETEIRNKIELLERRPILVIISTTDDFASQKYINNKIKKGTELGFDVQLLKFGPEASTQDICDLIQSYSCDGIIVQLPLADHLNGSVIINSIPVEKDVDGFTRYHQANLMIFGKSELMPCTPAGILRVLKYTQNLVSGKNVVIINRSNIVGKPMSMMLLADDYSVSVCHSKTNKVCDYTRHADIIITACGQKDFIDESMVSFDHNQLIIDVSINRDSNTGKVCGDVNHKIYDYSHIFVTPTPGGIGPMTVLQLMDNTVNSALHLPI